MSDKVDLRVDWCSYQAAKYAVEHWHYSERMPKSKIVHIGAWENGNFIGCVLFNVSANNNLGKPYGLSAQEVVELVRIAMREHKSTITKIVSISIGMLRRQSPGLRLIVS